MHLYVCICLLVIVCVCALQCVHIYTCVERKGGSGEKLGRQREAEGVEVHEEKRGLEMLASCLN